MAKQQGIDDAYQAIRAAIKAALEQVGKKGAKPTEIAVNKGRGTSTKIIEGDMLNNFKGKVKINSRVPVQMETYAKGSKEYKQALKELRAKQAAFKKINKVNPKSARAADEYRAAQSAEERIKDWSNLGKLDPAREAADRTTVKNYLSPKKGRK